MSKRILLFLAALASVLVLSFSGSTAQAATMTGHDDDFSGNLPTLKKGYYWNDPIVKLWQKIVAVEFNIGCSFVDGQFGDNTLSKTKSWQSRNGTSADGQVGPNTWGKADELFHGSRESYGTDGGYAGRSDYFWEPQYPYQDNYGWYRYTYYKIWSKSNSYNWLYIQVREHRDGVRTFWFKSNCAGWNLVST